MGGTRLSLLLCKLPARLLAGSWLMQYNIIVLNAKTSKNDFERNLTCARLGRLKSTGLSLHPEVKSHR